MKNEKTSWGAVAPWYDELLEKGEGTYQKEVILPNLLRFLNIQKSDRVLDLACGQGFFSREIAKAGASVVASDVAEELIALARKNSPQEIAFHVAPADKLPFLKDGSIDKIVIVLALQNIENIAGVFKECSRALAPHGTVYVVINHPTFRIPKSSAWGWDEEHKIQYRRIDRYMSETREKIEMNPGQQGAKTYTLSFHRPLQVYFKALHKAGFAVARLEEWISHKESKPGQRADAENLARHEIPLFMCLEIAKL